MNVKCGISSLLILEGIDRTEFYDGSRLLIDNQVPLC